MQFDIAIEFFSPSRWFRLANTSFDDKVGGFDWKTWCWEKYGYVKLDREQGVAEIYGRILGIEFMLRARNYSNE